MTNPVSKKTDSENLQGLPHYFLFTAEVVAKQKGEKEMPFPSHPGGVKRVVGEKLLTSI